MKQQILRHFRRRWLYYVALALVGLLILDQLHPAGRLGVFSVQREVPTLVLDAGHGGFDGGAVSPNGVTEQQINLSIVYKVRDLAGLFGQSSVLTRPDDQALDYEAGRSVRENKAADIRARARICEQTEQPIFISIHLNKFEQSQYFGAQVFYGAADPDSKVLAEAIQTALKDGIDNGNTRVAKPAGDTIYLMRHLTCPALIVECGFLSNPEEETRLCEDTYQTQLATCIVAGYLQA